MSVYESANSVVLSVSVSDILEGKVSIPYLPPNSWKSAQQNDSCLRRAYAHLVAGRYKTVSRNISDLREVLRLASVDSQKDILVVRKEDPFVGTRNLTLCLSS